MTKSLSADLRSDYLFLPSGWNDGWMAQRARAAGGGILNINNFGDSIAAGVNANAMANSFMEKVTAYFASLYGTYGDYFSSVYANGLPPGTPWAGGGTRFDGVGFNATNYSSSLAAAVQSTFTSPYPTSEIDFLYFDSYAAAASTFAYSVDGAAQQTVSNAANGQIKMIQATGLSPSVTHTLGWGWQSVNAACFSVGAQCLKPGQQGGVFHARFGGPGCCLSQTKYSSGGNGLLRQADLFSNKSPLSDSGVHGTPFGYPLGAHLAIISMVTNDIAGAFATSAVETSATYLVRALRRANPACSVLFVIPSYPDPNYDNSTQSYANPSTAFTYHNVLYNTARRFNCAILDVHDKWGADPVTPGFLPLSDLHPTPAGHADIANTLLTIL